MTAAARDVRLASPARAAALLLGGTRVAVYAGIAAVAVAALPDGASLALARWSGARLVVAHFAHPSIGWLGELCAWLIAFGGIAAALFATATAAVVAFTCTERRAGLRADRTTALAAVVVAALCSLGAIHAGGSGLLAAAFAAALALVLARTGARATIVAAALAAVWCNASPDGILAPFIALTRALAASSPDVPVAARRWAWYAAGACALATLATPAFGAFPAEAVAALGAGGALDGLIGMHPAQVAPAAYRVGFTLVVVAFLAVGSGARVRAGDALLVVLATLLALANGAYLGVFGVLVAPVLAGSFDQSFRRRSMRTSRGDANDGDTNDGAASVAALALAGVLACVLAPRADAHLAAQPYRLADTIGNARHRLYCADLAWCSYALATGRRGTSVLLDARVTAYSAADVRAQRNVAQLSPGWRATLRREGVDALLVRRDRALATLVRLRGGWRLAASDASAELFVRSNARR